MAGHQIPTGLTTITPSQDANTPLERDIEMRPTSLIAASAAPAASHRRRTPPGLLFACTALRIKTCGGAVTHPYRAGASGPITASGMGRPRPGPGEHGAYTS